MRGEQAGGPAMTGVGYGRLDAVAMCEYTNIDAAGSQRLHYASPKSARDVLDLEIFQQSLLQ